MINIQNITENANLLFEEYPKCFNRLKPEFKKVLNFATSGHDIQNIRCEKVNITNYKEIKTFSPRVLFFFVGKNPDEIIVTRFNSAIVNQSPLVFKNEYDIGLSEWRSIFKFAKEIYALRFDQENYGNLLQKQQARREAKLGSHVKVDGVYPYANPTKHSSYADPEYDKSGYKSRVTDRLVDKLTNKYLSNPESLLDRLETFKSKIHKHRQYEVQILIDKLQYSMQNHQAKDFVHHVISAAKELSDIYRIPF